MLLGEPSTWPFAEPFSPLIAVSSFRQLAALLEIMLYVFTWINPISSVSGDLGKGELGHMRLRFISRCYSDTARSSAFGGYGKLFSILGEEIVLIGSATVGAMGAAPQPCTLAFTYLIDIAAAQGKRSVAFFLRSL